MGKCEAPCRTGDMVRLRQATNNRPLANAALAKVKAPLSIRLSRHLELEMRLRIFLVIGHGHNNFI